MNDTNLSELLLVIRINDTLDEILEGRKGQDTSITSRQFKKALKLIVAGLLSMEDAE